MAPRALGALLAIAAAIAFVVSIASSAWWAGHPTVDGQTITAKHVSVGPLGATGCNTGGDGSCEAVPTTASAELVGIVAIAATGLATLFALMLAISAWSMGDRRKGLARATLVVTLGAAVAGGALLALGPGIKTQHIGVPLGWGFYVFGGAIVSSLLASAITRKLEPEPLRLKSGVAPPAPPPDVRDLVRQDHEGLAPRDSVPLFGSAPQLRPLYDPGNQGYVPAPPSPSLPMQPPEPYGRAQVKALTGQYTPTPEKVNPLGSSNPGVRTQAPSNPPPLNAPMPRPGDPLGPPVDPFARTAPRPQGGEAPPMSPPPPRPKSPSASPPPRAKAPSASPPHRGKSASAPPPLRSKAPSAAPPPHRGKPGSAPPPSPRAPVSPQPRARTELGPGTDPLGKKLETAAASEPELRPSAPTIAHAIPPMPRPDNQTPPSVLPARDVTAVEIDTEAKAVAEATARGQLDPRLAARVPRSATDARTGQHEARIADVTSTGVDVESAPRTAATTSENVIAPPPAQNQRIITGEQRSLSTMQRNVARAPTEDQFQSGKAHMLVPADELDDELAPRSAEMAAEEGPVTEVHSIPSAQDLADEIASQAASGLIGDVTAATSPPIDLQRLPETTPIPTFHGPRPTPSSMSTASASLPPPRTVDAAPHGPTPACPQCESPMAWVEEHLRFYCKQCRMYF